MKSEHFSITTIALSFCCWKLDSLARTCSVLRFLTCKFKHWVAKCRSLEKHYWDEFFEYGTVWQVLVSISLFRTNFWLTVVVQFLKVNHISNHGFKCLLGSVIPTEKSECGAKFCFTSDSIVSVKDFLLNFSHLVLIR